MGPIEWSFLSKSIAVSTSNKETSGKEWGVRRETLARAAYCRLVWLREKQHLNIGLFMG
jgi:hypothetical protein